MVLFGQVHMQQSLIEWSKEMSQVALVSVSSYAMRPSLTAGHSSIQSRHFLFLQSFWRAKFLLSVLPASVAWARFGRPMIPCCRAPFWALEDGCRAMVTNAGWNWFIIAPTFGYRASLLVAKIFPNVLLFFSSSACFNYLSLPAAKIGQKIHCWDIWTPHLLLRGEFCFNPLLSL